MTKEDALFFLVRFRTEGINEKLYDALGVAIEALNAQTDKRTETHACDLISRAAAIDVIEAGRLTKLIDAEIAVNGLKALPAADAVPVVRCRDCKYRDRESDFCYGRGLPVQLVPDDGFCDKGKGR